MHTTTLAAAERANSKFMPSVNQMDLSSPFTPPIFWMKEPTQDMAITPIKRLAQASAMAAG